MTGAPGPKRTDARALLALRATFQDAARAGAALVRRTPGTPLASL